MQGGAKGEGQEALKDLKVLSLMLRCKIGGVVLLLWIVGGGKQRWGSGAGVVDGVVGNVTAAGVDRVGGENIN